MKRSLVVVCLAAVVSFLSTPSFAQTAHVHGGKADFSVSTPVVVGSTTLQPGEYKVQCLDIDGKEYLVVKSAESGKEVARVACKSEPIDKKVTESAVVTSAGADGAKKLTAVRIKGEMATHVVVP